MKIEWNVVEFGEVDVNLELSSKGNPKCSWEVVFEVSVCGWSSGFNEGRKGAVVVVVEVSGDEQAVLTFK